MPQKIEASYDAVAHIYDQFYKTPDAISENWVVQQLLNESVMECVAKGFDIIDIGSGTGLFLDLFPWADETTTNLDPSWAMLQVLNKKHNAARVVHGDHRSVEGLAAAALVVSLFSSLCYAPKDEVKPCLQRATRLGGDVFVMFAAPGEDHSLVLKHAGVEARLSAWSVAEVQELAESLHPVRQRVVQVNRFVCMCLHGVGNG